MEEQDYTLEQIVEASFDFSDYSEEEKKEVISETSGMLMEAALLRSLGNEGAEVQEKFNTFIEAEPNEEAIADFIGKNLPNFQSIMVEEIKTFQEMGIQEKPE